MANNFSAKEVFGVQNRSTPLNYVLRDDVDSRFQKAIGDREHVVVFGGSKQGKTSLRRTYVDDSQCLIVPVSGTWKLSDLFDRILAGCGIQLRSATKKKLAGKGNVTARVSVPKFVEIGVGAEIGGERERSLRDYEVNPSDASDIVRLLTDIDFAKIIVIEDFHYLPSDTQRDFSLALKTIIEHSDIKFIVIGVWLGTDKLQTYNGDLIGRIVCINADKWSDSELAKVISKGADLLNVEFEGEVSNSIVRHARGSVHLVQEICLRICEMEGVLRTSATRQSLGRFADINRIAKDVVQGYTDRYEGILRGVAAAARADPERMEAWCLRAAIKHAIFLEGGLSVDVVKNFVSEHHPRGNQFRKPRITAGIRALVATQLKLGVRPIVLDFDANSGLLKCVDRGLLLWLEHQQLDDVFESIDVL
jgi:(2Fe-2S) ferredoxin